MKKALRIVAVAGLAIFLVISLAQAEKKETAPSGQMGMMGRGGMMGQGGMMKPGMMQGMMGMSCPMMGMMGGQAMDPKMQGEMMVLKGQMMKNMAEMMSKQGDWMIQQGTKQAKEEGK